MREKKREKKIRLKAAAAQSVLRHLGSIKRMFTDSEWIVLIGEAFV